MKLAQGQIGLLLAQTYRSRALVQFLATEGIRISNAVVLTGDCPVWDGPERISVPLYDDCGSANKTIGPFIFRPAEDLFETLEQQQISYKISPTQDINSSEFVEFIKSFKEGVFLYSGLAGCILRQEILASGKKFIHSHGGDAPRYSGSTAFYYSILEAGLIGASVFWMDEGIDTGEMITKICASPVAGLEIDRVQDPVIRAQAFAKALWLLFDGKYDDKLVKQSYDGRRTYHVIHPVLKHLALKKCGLLGD